MKRTLQAVFLTLLAAEVLVVGQGDEARRVLGGIRAALGGEEKLSAVRTLTVEGQLTRVINDASRSSGFEMAFELPARFVKKEEFGNMNGVSLMRRSGFNGSDVIEEMDTPPPMGGGGMHVMRLSAGGPMLAGKATPEQLEAQKKQALASNRREFARLALGMFGASFEAFPVEFKYVGQAESADGKADILEVQGADGFTAKLFVDGTTHLPLMLSWMDKEPLRITMAPGGAAAGDPARMQQELAERMKEAEANRRTVEFRMFYGDYKAFSGVRLPTRIQRMMDGLATEELTFEKVKVNPRIDASTFSTGK